MDIHDNGLSLCMCVCVCVCVCVYDGDVTSQHKDPLSDIGDLMTRSKTKRMRYVLQRPNNRDQVCSKVD